MNWTDCLDAPCTVDPRNPNKAICTCKIQQSAGFVTYGGRCNQDTCENHYWSGATPQAFDLGSAALMSVLDLTKDQDLPIDARLINGSVYSGQLEWVPMGEQAETFADNPPTVVNPNILLARLRPGQEIDMELKCEKGLGKDHAKWSPVCTASYRLLPDVKIVGDPILDDEIPQAQMICGKDVFDIVDRDDGHKEAVLARPHLCSMARNGFTDEWNKRIKIYRIKDHFIFSIESVGQYTAAELFTEAVGVLIKKAQTVSAALDAPDGGDGTVRDRTTRT